MTAMRKRRKTGSPDADSSGGGVQHRSSRRLAMQDPRNKHLSQLAQAFGSPRDRYRIVSHSMTSTALGSASPSKYFKVRGEVIARSTTRERSGASGNCPVTVMGYSRDGTPMRGVSAFPFEKQQNAYVEDFAPIVANQLVHPFNAITENNAASTAHNIITGSAYHAALDAASEYKREYKHGAGAFAQIDSKRGRPFGSFAPMNPGLRSEEMITVGQYTPVLRSGSPRAGYSAS